MWGGWPNLSDPRYSVGGLMENGGLLFRMSEFLLLGVKPGRRLLEQGAEACTDAEILGILLGSGGPGYTALDSASALLDKYGTLSALMDRSLEEIAGIRGIKATRAIRLAAAYELCKRLLKEIDRDA
jgi:DNA repair protein RadC